MTLLKVAIVRKKQPFLDLLTIVIVNVTISHFILSHIYLFYFFSEAERAPILYEIYCWLALGVVIHKQLVNN